MTRDELLKFLINIKIHAGDKELDHAQADNALLEYINDDQITAAFDAIEKWYA